MIGECERKEQICRIKVNQAIIPGAVTTHPLSYRGANRSAIFYTKIRYKGIKEKAQNARAHTSQCGIISSTTKSPNTNRSDLKDPSRVAPHMARYN